MKKGEKEQKQCVICGDLIYMYVTANDKIICLDCYNDDDDIIQKKVDKILFKND